jgi:hypothetical protein
MHISAQATSDNPGTNATRVTRPKLMKRWQQPASGKDAGFRLKGFVLLADCTVAPCFGFLSHHKYTKHRQAQIRVALRL